MMHAIEPGFLSWLSQSPWLHIVADVRRSRHSDLLFLVHVLGLLFSVSLVQIQSAMYNADMLKAFYRPKEAE
jgi:hypothetical protein